MDQLLANPHSVPQFTLKDGLLKFKNRVWVGNVLLHTKLIATVHDSPIGGHSGFPVTLRKLKQYFFLDRHGDFISNLRSKL
jgi:hypothetical protein